MYESETIIHSLANFISMFREKIVKHHGYETWTLMTTSKVISNADIENTVTSFGLSLCSWRKCVNLAHILNEQKHGSVEASKCKEMLSKLVGSNYDEYVTPLTDLTELMNSNYLRYPVNKF